MNHHQKQQHQTKPALRDRLKSNQKRDHWWVGLGGTFDHFHAGHEAFISFAAAQGENIIIGITADYVNTYKPFAHTIQPFRIRAKNVRHWCQQQGISHEIVMIDDVYGPTLTDKRIKALAVTEETVSGAEKINEVREASSMRELPVYIFPLVNDETGKPLHSTAIRAGSTNRRGIVYSNHIPIDQQFTQKQREKLAQPLGKLFPSITTLNQQPTASPVVLVGDATLQNFLKYNQSFDIAIIDHKTQRQSLSQTQTDLLNSFVTTQKPIIKQTTNPAGSISTALLNEITTLAQNQQNQSNQLTGSNKNQNQNKNQNKNKTKKQTLIVVDGEEDLATICLLLTMPLGSVIYYGQPNQGLVQITVTEDSKEHMLSLLTRNAEITEHTETEKLY